MLRSGTCAARSSTSLRRMKRSGNPASYSSAPSVSPPPVPSSSSANCWSCPTDTRQAVGCHGRPRSMPAPIRLQHEQKAPLSKAGNRYLRIALYMPALSAARHDPNVGPSTAILSIPAASRSPRLSTRSCVNSCSPSMPCLERTLPSTATASSHPLKRPLNKSNGSR